MSLILNIETSTSVCSVALSVDNGVIDFRESHGERSHATRLTPFIDDILQKAGTVPEKLDAIAVSKGPGSYTGLRIGVATAKGMAYSLGKPLIAIDTMLCMCHGLLKENPGLSGHDDTLLCPMIDARRMEVFLAVYKSNLSVLQEVRAEIITANSFKDILESQKVIFFGDGMNKCRQVLHHENAVFIDDFNPLARYLALISHSYFVNNNFVDVAYFEPYYLKDFMATTPKNSLLQKRR